MNELVLKTLVVEDRDADLSVLKTTLEPFEDIIHIFKIAKTFDEAVSILTNDTFDLSILDIELDKNYDCYELVNIFGKERFGIIAFNTIKTQVPIDKTQKIGRFLLLPKPYSTIGTAKFIIELQDEISLLQSVKNSGYITLLDKGLHIKMPLKNVFYIHATGSHSEFICKDEKQHYKKYSQNGNLGKFDYLLSTDIFLKCERSYFVNKHLIQGIKKSEAAIYFDLERKIPVAYYAEWFKDWLDKNGF